MVGWLMTIIAGRNQTVRTGRSASCIVFSTDFHEEVGCYDPELQRHEIAQSERPARVPWEVITCEAKRTVRRGSTDRLPGNTGHAKAGCYERKRLAASSGLTGLIQISVPHSKPAPRVSRGMISTYQWSFESPSNGAVCKSRL